MPGLFGIIGKPDADTFERMAAALQHHAFETIDRYSGPDALIGRVGAANTGPWTAECLSAGVMLNPGCGFYVQAAHRDGRTTITVDRRASVPVFYAQVSGTLYFAPEPKALIQVPGLVKELDLEAVATFIASGHLLADQSLLQSIRRLRNGHSLVVDHGMTRTERYWTFAPGAQANGTSSRDLEVELAELVEEAVARNLSDDTVIFLSGGFDSRGILAAALQSGQPISSVTWGTSGAEGSDVHIAAQIAAHYGLHHRVAERRHDTYPEDFQVTNRLIDALADVATEHPSEYRLMLDLRTQGFGRALRGDEVFGWRARIFNHDQAAAEVGLKRLRNLDIEYLRPDFRGQLEEASESAYARTISEVRDLPPNQAKDRLYMEQRVAGYLGVANYYKLVALDVRNPLLDESILDFMAKVPDRLRADKLLYRRAMRRHYPRLWRIPLAHRTSLEDWGSLLASDTPVRRYIAAQLEDVHSGVWQYFDRHRLQSMLRRITARRPQRAWKSLAKRAAYAVMPRYAASEHCRNEARHHPANRALFRIIALKQWYDGIF